MAGTGTNSKGLPFLFIFEAVLDAMAIVDFVKAFRLNEHLLTLQQARNAFLTRLGSFFAFEFRGITGKIIRWLLVSRYITFEVAQNDFVI